jgi:hypothetical protein
LKKKSFGITLVIELLVLSGLWLQSPVLMASPGTESAEYETIFPTRTQVKPRIDGVLDDNTWQTPIKKEYINYWPVYGETFGFETMAWLAYDDEN